MFISFFRIIKSGFQIFRRNLMLFSATIVVLSLMLFVFVGLFTLYFFSERALEEVQERIVMLVYFDATADESGILRARDLLAQLPEVKYVEYISRDEALERFRERHRENIVMMRALEEVGSNPLQASLRIRAIDSMQYASIAQFLENAPFQNQISRVNFLENQLIIERLNHIIATTREVGIALAVILAAIAIIVFFSTMRIAIYTFRNEIAIMKLVGASNNFARGPFAVAGITAGVIAAAISFLLFITIMKAAAPHLETFMPGLGVGEFLASAALGVFAIQLALGAGMGMLASSFATNKYLKV